MWFSGLRLIAFLQLSVIATSASSQTGYREIDTFERCINSDELMFIHLSCDEGITRNYWDGKELAQAYVRRSYYEITREYYNDALISLNNAIEIEKNHFTANLNRSYLLAVMGDLNSAERDAKNAIIQKDESPSATHNHALILASLERCSEAIDAVNNYIGESELLNKTKTIVLTACGKLEEAINNLTAHIESGESDLRDYEKRGSLFLELGKPSQALEDFSRVITTRPDESLEVYFNSARALIMMNRFKDAVDVWVNSLTVFKGNHPLSVISWKILLSRQGHYILTADEKSRELISPQMSDEFIEALLRCAQEDGCAPRFEGEESVYLPDELKFHDGRIEGGTYPLE